MLAGWLLLPATSGATTLTSTTVAVSPNGTRVYAGFNGVGFSVFSRDTSTGQLAVLGQAPGSPTGGGLLSPSIAISPDSANVYGVNGLDNRLLQYAPTSEGVALQQSYPVLADTTIAKDPTALTISPDGSSVYVLTYGVQLGTGIGVSSAGKINAFHRDPTTGNLTLVGTTQLDGGAVGAQPVVSPDGRFVYVAGGFPGGIDVLSRDTSTGALSVVGHDGDLNGGVAITISPDGNFVYETGPSSQSSSNSSAISILSRNPTTGRLTAAGRITNGADNVSGLSDMWGVAASPDGHCLYATSRADGALGYFTRDATTGALTFGGVVTEGSGGVTGLRNARGVVVSPDGNDIYVASPDDNGASVFGRDLTTCAPSFLQVAQDLFTLGPPSVNQTDGTATLPVNVDTSGALDTSVAPVTAQTTAHLAARTGQVIQVDRAGVVKVPITLDPQAAAELDALHTLNVKATVTFTARGGAPTTKTTVIRLVKAPPSLSKLGVFPSKFSLAGRKVKGRCVAPTKKNRASKRCRRAIALRVSYTLNAPAPVTFTFKFQAPGRKLRGRCVAPTRKTSKLKRCTRLLDVRGKLVKTGAAGPNRLTFNGQIAGRRFGPGTYQLLATPSGSKPTKVTFKIVS